MANTVPTEQVATFCNLTARRIQQLVKEGMPQESRGQFVFAAAIQLYIGYIQDKLKAHGSGTSNKEVKDSRSRYLEMQTESAELDLKLKQGKLLDVNDVQMVMNEVMQGFAYDLDGVAGRFAADLSAENDPANIQVMLFEEHRRIREAAADRIRSMGSGDELTIDPTATTKKISGRVGRRKQSATPRKRRKRPVEK